MPAAIPELFASSTMSRKTYARQVENVGAKNGQLQDKDVEEDGEEKLEEEEKECNSHSELQKGSCNQSFERSPPVLPHRNERTGRRKVDSQTDVIPLLLPCVIDLDNKSMQKERQADATNQSRFHCAEDCKEREVMRAKRKRGTESHSGDASSSFSVDEDQDQDEYENGNDAAPSGDIIPDWAALLKMSQERARRGVDSSNFVGKYQGKGTEKEPGCYRQKQINTEGPIEWGSDPPPRPPDDTVPDCTDEEPSASVKSSTWWLDMLGQIEKERKELEQAIIDAKTKKGYDLDDFWYPPTDPLDENQDLDFGSVTEWAWGHPSGKVNFWLRTSEIEAWMEGWGNVGSVGNAKPRDMWEAHGFDEWWKGKTRTRTEKEIGEEGSDLSEKWKTYVENLNEGTSSQTEEAEEYDDEGEKGFREEYWNGKLWEFFDGGWWTWDNEAKAYKNEEGRVCEANYDEAVLEEGYESGGVQIPSSLPTAVEENAITRGKADAETHDPYSDAEVIDFGRPPLPLAQLLEDTVAAAAVLQSSEPQDSAPQNSGSSDDESTSDSDDSLPLDYDPGLFGIERVPTQRIASPTDIQTQQPTRRPPPVAERQLPEREPPPTYGESQRG